ncbi:MAG: hypothetical protein WC838_02885, partial [Candidatus Margulisiibacteriota bacterium]
MQTGSINTAFLADRQRSVYPVEGLYDRLNAQQELLLKLKPATLNSTAYDIVTKTMEVQRKLLQMLAKPMSQRSQAMAIAQFKTGEASINDRIAGMRKQQDLAPEAKELTRSAQPASRTAVPAKHEETPESIQKKKTWAILLSLQAEGNRAVADRKIKAEQELAKAQKAKAKAAGAQIVTASRTGNPVWTNPNYTYEIVNGQVIPPRKVPVSRNPHILYDASWQQEAATEKAKVSKLPIAPEPVIQPVRAAAVVSQQMLDRSIPIKDIYYNNNLDTGPFSLNSAEFKQLCCDLLNDKIDFEEYAHQAKELPGYRYLAVNLKELLEKALTKCPSISQDAIRTKFGETGGGFMYTKMVEKILKVSIYGLPMMAA